MILTPCINVCRIQSNICVGCHRTLEQIAKWSKYTDEQRLEIMQKISPDGGVLDSTGCASSRTDNSPEQV